MRCKLFLLDNETPIAFVARRRLCQPRSHSFTRELGGHLHNAVLAGYAPIAFVAGRGHRDARQCGRKLGLESLYGTADAEILRSHSEITFAGRKLELLRHGSSPVRFAETEIPLPQPSQFLAKMLTCPAPDFQSNQPEKSGKLIGIGERVRIAI